MRHFALLAAVLAVACVAPLAFGAGETAIAKIFGTDWDPSVTGYVKFTALNSSHVRVHVNISGITINPDSDHGVHVHILGDISHVNGSNAGVHLTLKSNADGNPCAVGSCTNHGCPETSGQNRHAGDMGNFAAVGGVIDQAKDLDLLALTTTYTIVGHSVILHERADDCLSTTPTGNAGGRLGQGVIGLLKGNNQVVDSLQQSIVNPSATAVCVLRGTSNAPNVKGLFFAKTQDESNVRITGYIRNVNVTANSSGKWGIHIHQYGDLITDANGVSAGSHFNPGGSIHALPPAADRHIGDLGNVHYVNDNDLLFYTESLGFGIRDYFINTDSIMGRALVLHAMEDDGCNQANLGNAGARLAWCVWGIGDSTISESTISAAAGVGSFPSIPAQTGKNCFPDAPSLPDAPDGGASAMVGSVFLVLSAIFALLLTL